jgi:hypothetical protein
MGYSVTGMMTANGILLMQVQGGGLLLNCNSTTGTAPYSDPNIMANPILQFYYNNSAYYILYSSGLVSVTLNASSAQFIGSVAMVALPNNTYRLVFGTVLNVVYIQLTPYIYKADCPIQTYASGLGSCTSYACTVPNCASCWLTVDTCGVCASGYIRNNNLTCTFQNTSNNATTTNTSTATNSNTNSSTGTNSSN